MKKRRESMALSRSEAEKHGLAFVHEGEKFRSDPDQEVWSADITIDGHTEKIQGKSEDDVLFAATSLLGTRGKLGKTPVKSTSLKATDDSDLHTRRNDNDDPA